MTNGRRQGIFYILTIPEQDWAPPTNLPEWCQWIRGQKEQGEGGFVHWQVCVAFRSKQSLVRAKSFFCRTAHLELTRSEAAADYVWKEATRVEGSQFELGTKPFRRNSKVDWEMVWNSAITGSMASIPACVRVCHYRTLQQIASDHQSVPFLERECVVFYGRTGTGKSRRAWEEAGQDAYPKDPRTKFWCGYHGQANVIIDEFRGGIDVSHILRWLDRYPVRVEIKGSTRPLYARKYWITSNVHPERWWPELDPETLAAILRRMTIEEFN